MKIIRNADKCYCIRCFSFFTRAIIRNNHAVCEYCNSPDLIDATGGPFEPIFGSDRRCPERVGQVEEERRAA